MFGVNSANPDSSQYNEFAAFGLMVPIFAGYVAFSIADRPGLAPGAIGGMIASTGGSGFLGGLIAGYAILLLKKVLVKLPKSLPLRRDMVAKEAIHLALGIRPDGTKEVLNYQVAPTESAEIWRELLEILKNQEVEDVLLFVTDSLKGLDTVLSECFPKAKQQRCLVHIARNICHNVRITDRKETMNDFKQIHQAKEKGQAVQSLNDFLAKWQKRYPKIIKKLEEQENLLTFFEFPPSIRCSIYSTNLIEGFNKHLKRTTKKKEQFPNEESLNRFLVTQFLDYNTKHDDRCHRGFSQDRDTLESMFI